MGKNDTTTTTDSSSEIHQRDNVVIGKLKTATYLCSIFLVVEVAGGILSGSLAVLSDAAHLLADLASFAVAIAASHLASLPTTRKHTYGLKRCESLAALFSVTSLAFISLGLAYRAVVRLANPPDEPVDGPLMTTIAGIGLVVNIAMAFVLGEHHVHLPGGSSCDHGHDHHGQHDHGQHDHGKGCCHGHHDDEGDEPEAHREECDHDAHGDHSHHGHSCGGHSHDDHHHHDDHSHDDHSHDHHSHDKDHHHHHGGKQQHANDDREVGNESSPLLVPKGSSDHDGDRYHQQQERKRNVNLHATYLHVLGDLAQSLAVFLGGLVISWKPEWHIIDPVLTLAFSVLVLYSTTGVMRSSLAILLEETPANIRWQDVYDKISAVPNVDDVHDLHIWCISQDSTALSLHCSSSDENAIENINKVCRGFGIKHTTIQVNRGRCGTCPSDQRSSSSYNESVCEQVQ
eukprot:CAMPEP_0197177232 /NCGR_PEP_ID=MMETSP1423-20130617/2916_1 /TAXON_ID=476441 /ORGANISM="Pseudo-nitzschia heimii, Strain UNC1101" /LENGTH=457 /DNA_ID=CAMNT_0042626755 /DNA_START=179 /DNA_END=1552 /DNA_ORIENTATION=+